MKNIKKLFIALLLVTITTISHAQFFEGIGEAIGGAVEGAGRVVEGAVEGTGRAVEGVVQGTADIVAPDRVVIEDEEPVETIELEEEEIE